MHRKKTYNEQIAKRLQNNKYARGFLLSLMEDESEEEGLSLLEALKLTIESMGIKEFSAKSKIPSSNICRMLKQNDIPKVNTLNKYLKPFKLKVKLDVEEAA